MATTLFGTNALNSKLGTHDMTEICRPQGVLGMLF